MARKRNTVIRSLCVGTFPHKTTQAEAAAHWGSYLEGNPAVLCHVAHKKSGVATRFLAFRPGECTSDIDIKERMERVAATAVPLVEETAKRALLESGCEAKEIGQLIFVSSTVLSAPGFGLAIIEALGISTNVVRTPLVFTGCAAGIQALRLAAQFFATASRNAPSASLIVCIEVSSAHAAAPTSRGEWATHAIFGDGIACAIVGSPPVSPRYHAGLIEIGTFHSVLASFPEGIRLHLKNRVVCTLSPRLPRAIREAVAEWWRTLPSKRRMSTINQMDFFALHTGGIPITKAAIDGIGVGEEKAWATREILAEYGNTVSCGIFFVLRRMLDKHAILPGQQGIALSFAPGVSTEGLLLRTLPSKKHPRDGKRMRIKKFHGAVVPQWASPDMGNTLNSLEHLGEKNDVYVVAYPRSGTTWTLQILSSLLHPEKQNIPLPQRVLWIERGDQVTRTQQSPRIIKTHLLPQMLQSLPGRRIYVARHPCEVASSYFYHARGKKDLGFIGNWEEFFTLFLAGDVEGGKWENHLLDAMEQDMPIFWYGDLLRDPMATVSKIASALGVHPNKTLLMRVVQKSTLQAMRDDPSINGKWTTQRRGEAPHLRLGEPDDWRRLFTSEQILKYRGMLNRLMKKRPALTVYLQHLELE